MQRIVLTLVLTFLVGALFAQPGKVPIKNINGKNYYVHKVKRGNTVYGLHQMYNVPVDDIMASNPSAKNGLQVGQEISSNLLIGSAFRVKNSCRHCSSLG